MRKYVKKQLLGILSALENSETDLKQLCKTKMEESLHILLTEMQQTAIDVGNEVEKTENAEIPLIHHLEEYCELIWQCSIAVTWQEKQETIKLITKKRVQAYNSLKYDIPERYEVVFLTYKASMWDSLESVWLAAKEDNECDSYVIPIPYFDKNADGSLGAMNYEADQMPDYVPITDYSAYDLKNHHPEVIYFHNPYDQHNYVTSVHPDYYSVKLKECTELLVYIPYFVSLDNVPEHLCSNIGVFRADRVIVESEKVRQTYMKVFMEAIGEKQKQIDKATGKENMEYWSKLKQLAEEKFLALGSPKFDKVINTKIEDVSVPEEWENLIRREDGSRNKVIFYNTTVDAILRNRKKVLEKIKSVIKAFQREKDVVLLWRPHPLSQATINSIAPELADDYEKIVLEYRSEGWGIYDDTADLNRAITISDAYYGDKSSVVALYKLTGKPIMIQNFEVVE